MVEQEQGTEVLEDMIVKFMLNPVAYKTLEEILEHVKEHPEIRKLTTKRTQDQNKDKTPKSIESMIKRNQRDKLRRIINNSQRIFSTTENTRKKRYYSFETPLREYSTWFGDHLPTDPKEEIQWVKRTFTGDILFQRITQDENETPFIPDANLSFVNKEIFILNEKLGGLAHTDTLAEILHRRCLLSKDPLHEGFGPSRNFTDTFKRFHDWLDLIRFYQNPWSNLSRFLINSEIEPDEEKGYPFQWEVAYEKEAITSDENSELNHSLKKIIMPSPEAWFVPQKDWIATSSFGFQGPRILKDIIENISKSIDSIDEDVLKNQYQGVLCSNIKREIKWLKENKNSKVKRYPNKDIITLAILHLNRSLQASIDPNFFRRDIIANNPNYVEMDLDEEKKIDDSQIMEIYGFSDENLPIWQQATNDQIADMWITKQIISRQACSYLRKKNDWNYTYSLNWLLEHPRWLKATNEQIADMWITKQIKIDYIFNLLKQKNGWNYSYSSDWLDKYQRKMDKVTDSANSVI